MAFKSDYRGVIDLPTSTSVKEGHGALLATLTWRLATDKGRCRFFLVTFIVISWLSDCLCNLMVIVFHSLWRLVVILTSSFWLSQFLLLWELRGLSHPSNDLVFICSWVNECARVWHKLSPDGGWVCIRTVNPWRSILWHLLIAWRCISSLARWLHCIILLKQLMALLTIGYITPLNPLKHLSMQ